MRQPQPIARSGRPVVSRTVTLHLTNHLATDILRLSRRHPQRTLDDLIGDIVGLGLLQFERNRRMPKKARPAPSHIVGRQPVYLPLGPFTEFHHLVYRHHLALENAKTRDGLRSSSEYALLDE